MLLARIILEDMISRSFATFTHTFLIRDPERVLYSNYSAPNPNPGPTKWRIARAIQVLQICEGEERNNSNRG